MVILQEGMDKGLRDSLVINVAQSLYDSIKKTALGKEHLATFAVGEIK